MAKLNSHKRGQGCSKYYVNSFQRDKDTFKGKAQGRIEGDLVAVW